MTRFDARLVFATVDAEAPRAYNETARQESSIRSRAESTAARRILKRLGALGFLVDKGVGNASMVPLDRGSLVMLDWHLDGAVIRPALRIANKSTARKRGWGCIERQLHSKPGSKQICRRW